MKPKRIRRKSRPRPQPRAVPPPDLFPIAGVLAGIGRALGLTPPLPPEPIEHYVVPAGSSEAIPVDRRDQDLKSERRRAGDGRAQERYSPIDPSNWR